MIFCMKLFCFFIVGIFIGCSNPPFMGAKKFIVKGGMYLERWYLNPEYNSSEVPSGSEFYGAAAEKIKDRFTIKYYIYDGERSDSEIPKSDMWVVNHNGKGWGKQDDDNFFYYKINEFGEYEKFLTGNAKYPFAISDGVLIAIRSCDVAGWCKLYPNSYSKELYVRKMILKEPLEQKHN